MRIGIGYIMKCAETGKLFLGRRDGCTTNYAQDHDPDDPKVWSDEGVYLAEQRRWRERDGPVTGYVSSDGKHITTWKGDPLGTVVNATKIRLSCASAFHGQYINAYTVFAKDRSGFWYGRGSPGLVINLRPYKKRYITED